MRLYRGRRLSPLEMKAGVCIFFVLQTLPQSQVIRGAVENRETNRSTVDEVSSQRAVAGSAAAGVLTLGYFNPLRRKAADPDCFVLFGALFVLRGLRFAGLSAGGGKRFGGRIRTERVASSGGALS